MNIIYLISFAGKAGTEKYVRNLLVECRGRGDRGHLVYCVPGALSEWAEKEHFPTLRLDLRPQKLLSAAKKLADYSRERKIHVIHAQYPRENVIAVLSRLWRRETEVVFTSHLTLSQGTLWRYVNRIMTPHNAAVISVCREGEGILRENGVCPEKLRVIPNGIEHRPLPPRQDVIRRELSLAPDTFVFLAMARFAPEKGLEDLVDAMDYVRSRASRPVCCFLCGDGEEYDRIGDRIRDRGLEQTVFCAGYRTDTEALYSSADAYVSSARCNEAMSFAILEAMEHALPLAVTEVGAGRELSRECGYVSAPMDAEALGENMLRLAENEKAAAAMGARARQRIEEEYDLSVQTDTLWMIYESAVKEGKSKKGLFKEKR